MQTGKHGANAVDVRYNLVYACMGFMSAHIVICWTAAVLSVVNCIILLNFNIAGVLINLYN